LNIFYLDEDITTNSKYHCNKHVIKMLIEYTQILCSAYYVTDSIPNNIYKATHKNHPCCIWARESLSNWIWLRDMTLALHEEYQHRYNKTHKSGELVKTLPIPNIKDIGVTKRPQAMPVQYRDLNTVLAYRNYYKAEKMHLIIDNNENIGYKNRDIPNWIY